MALPDLIDVATCLRWVPPNASEADVAALPTWIAAASSAVRRYCQQNFTAATYDELYDGGESSRVILRQLPVNAIDRFAYHAVTLLSITNEDQANQRASVTLATTGTLANHDLTSIGLTLTRVASGVTTIDNGGDPLRFADHPTVLALANAINGLGHGWKAVPANDYTLWASQDLRPVQGSNSAIGRPARFFAHVEEFGNFRLDGETGIIELTTPSGVFSPELWPDLPVEVSQSGITYRVGAQAYRIVYQAGYATEDLPADLVGAVGMVVQASMGRRAVNPSYSSRTLGDASYTLATITNETFIPRAALSILSLYRDSTR